MVKSENIKEILDRLEAQYPEAECALDHQNVFQLIVAVALSAQTTDKSVNQVTPDLFAKYPDAVSLAAAEPAEVEEYIKRIGMYRTKAKNIVGLARDLVHLHGGRSCSCFCMNHRSNSVHNLLIHPYRCFLKLSHHV